MTLKLGFLCFTQYVYYGHKCVYVGGAYLVKDTNDKHICNSNNGKNHYF